MPPLATLYLEDVLAQLEKLKATADGAIDQLTDDQLFVTLDAEANSVALLMKHLAGNMRSRWRDFLTTDGEKPDRHRDQEFEISALDSAASLRQSWESGWQTLLATVATMRAADLARQVTIRHEPHSVPQAIHRSLVHYAYHVGQIVQLAKHLRAADWQTLSVPRGQTAAYNEKMKRRWAHSPDISSSE